VWRDAFSAQPRLLRYRRHYVQFIENVIPRAEFHVACRVLGLSGIDV